jgi:hypothetical protein
LLGPGAALKEQVIYLLKFLTVLIRMTRLMMMTTMMTTGRSRWRQKGRRRRGIRKEYEENDEADSFRPAYW